MDWTEILSYEERPINGELRGGLYWAIPPKGSRKVGDPAGTIKHEKTGAIRKEVQYMGKKYSSSRIVWEMHYGTIPAGLRVGFKDEDSTNITLSNLELRTHTDTMLICYEIGKKVSNRRKLKYSVHTKRMLERWILLKLDRERYPELTITAYCRHINLNPSIYFNLRKKVYHLNPLLV